MIYLDHNATTPLARAAFEAMVPYLCERWGNPSSPYAFGNFARKAVEDGRGCIAELIGCSHEELLFCGTGTESDNLALRGAASALAHRGSHILTTAVEHPAVLSTCKALERQGFEVTYLPVTEEGQVDVAAFAESLRHETILATVMHANNETGVIHPVGELAAIARDRGVVFHTDAVQTAGKVPARLAELGADLVSFSAHKLSGPKGAAALYVRQGTKLLPSITGGSQERGLRAGTENVAAIVGFAAAAASAFAAAEAESVRLAGLRDRLERNVREAIPGTTINGARARRVANTSSLSFADVDGESVVLGLDLQGICVSTGSACSTGEAEPSHVLRAMGLSPRQAQGTIRVSLGRQTTREHIEAVTGALTKTVHRLRSISSVGSHGGGKGS